MKANLRVTLKACPVISKILLVPCFGFGLDLFITHVVWYFIIFL